jgi:two-component system, response regulator YesN
MAPYSVVVVEDERLIRANIVEKIELGDPRFTVVGTATDGAQALSILESQSVDVLFTDIRMPVMDGLALLGAVRAQFPSVQVVIISGYADFAYAQRAIHLGVEEYLLKPVKRDLVAEVLGKIAAKLSLAAQRAQLEAVRDAVNGSLNGRCAAASQKYALFLLNIGNLCGVTASNATRSVYEDLWRRFDLAALRILQPGLISVNAPEPNARYLALPLVEAADCAMTAETFYKELEGQATGLNVNLYYGAPAPLASLHDRACALRQALAQNLVMDAGGVSDIDAAAAKLPAAIVPAPVYSKLATLIGHGRIEAVAQEVSAMIDSALAQRQSQMWIQDYVHQIIELFQRHSTSTSKVEVYHAEYELFDGMSLPGSSAALFDRLWSILRTTLRDPLKELPASHELIDSIRSYLAANYHCAVSLEEVARRYGFTSSYLIRVFKRQVGESPIQYLIHLRMDEARRLLSAAPELEIREIGEIVGYADPHYFSRIFRNINGVTPTEFRARSARSE